MRFCRGVVWCFIAAGKPIQTGICEAFSGRMSDERLNETIFLDVVLDHARSGVAALTASYNHSRPHSALGYLTPTAFAQTLTATGDRLHNPNQHGRLRIPRHCERRFRTIVSSRSTGS